VPQTTRTANHAVDRRRSGVDRRSAAATATASGEAALADAQRAFETAVERALAALQTILAEVAALDERRAALVGDAEELAARIASLHPGAPLPELPVGPRPGPTPADRPASRRGRPASGDGGAGRAGGGERVLELLSRKALSLSELRDELGVSATRVQQLMRPLREQGRVVSEPDPDPARRRRVWRAA
jgi:DNA-binding MarR family transcriptional regulator